MIKFNIASARHHFKLEIRFCKNLAKLTGPAVRTNSKKPKCKKKNDERKKMEVATLGLEPAPQLPPAKKVRFLTTRPCDHYTIRMSKLTVLKYLSQPFTLFEPYGAVFIMNSKIQFEEK